MVIVTAAAEVSPPVRPFHLVEELVPITPAHVRLLLAGPACLLLAGCFSASAPAEDEPSDGTSARLRLAMLQPPRSALSPYSDDAFKLSRWSVTETLVELDDDGDPQPGPASSFEQVDPRT